MFDHGCDAINAGVGAMNLLIVLGICSGGEKVGRLGLWMRISRYTCAPPHFPAPFQRPHSITHTLHTTQAWDPFLVVSALATPFVPFYVATWEEYYVGKLVLPIINGPAEGVLLGVAIGEWFT